VPGSAKKLETTSEDLASWTVYVFNGFQSEAQKIVTKARDHHINVKEYPMYNQSVIDQKRGGTNVNSNFTDAETK